MGSMIRWCAARLEGALFVAGAAMIAYGCWLIFHPAGFIIAGLLWLGGGILAERGKR